jgi:hypothetical protein
MGATLWYLKSAFSTFFIINGERPREYNCVEPVNKNTIKEKHTHN